MVLLAQKPLFPLEVVRPLYCDINGVLKLLLSTKLKTENIRYILLKLINSSRAQVETFENMVEFARRFPLITDSGSFSVFFSQVSKLWYTAEGFCDWGSCIKTRLDEKENT